MSRGSYRVGRIRSGCTAVGAVLFVLVVTGPTWAQLSADDIAALREQGQREGWTFEIGENPATTRTLEQLCGFIVPPQAADEQASEPGFDTRADLPAHFDWREITGCPPMRDQGQCGSCWAFGTVGPLECNILIKDGLVVDLSEQWLVSCNDDGWGCDGGWWAHDYHQWKTDPCGGTGAVPENAFPYSASDAHCSCAYPHTYLLDDWTHFGWSVASVSEIKQAIYDTGPVSVAVYVNSAFQGYRGGVFNACSDRSVNHAVTLVGWDDTQGSNGVWILRNSWGSGWGEDGGYMRIEYGCSRVGYATCSIDYGNNRPTLVFDYPDGRPEWPEMAGTGVDTVFRVNILPETGTPVSGTAWLHFSTNGGDSYFTQAMREISPDQYEATLPGSDCLTYYDWYVSVEEAGGDRITDPLRAPAAPYRTIVASGTEVLFEDDFETDKGWTVEAGADAGNWERAAPEQTSADSTISQPGEDHSADGSFCFVTGAAAGSSPGANDVDGGPTRLISPVFDLAGRDAIISFWRWFHIGTEWDDVLRVRISNDNGETWEKVEKIWASEGWKQVEFRVSDYVIPTDTVLVRFGINDTDPGSLLEALIDDFKVIVVNCADPGDCPEDLNGDGVIDLQDLSQLLAHYRTTAGAQPDEGDIDRDGDVDLSDLSALLGVYGTDCD